MEIDQPENSNTRNAFRTADKPVVLGHVLRRVAEDVANDAHRRRRWVYEGVPHHELLEDVVLNRTLEYVLRCALLFGRGYVPEAFDGEAGNNAKVNSRFDQSQPGDLPLERSLLGVGRLASSLRRLLVHPSFLQGALLTAEHNNHTYIETGGNHTAMGTDYAIRTHIGCFRLTSENCENRPTLCRAVYDVFAMNVLDSINSARVYSMRSVTPSWSMVNHLHDSHTSCRER